MTRRRILSIDGGGTKGMFPASFLAHIESALRLRSVADHFDLIAGTSVGGIIAIGLGLGISAQEMVSFFIENGPKIFPDSGPIKKSFRLFSGKDRYSSKNLETALATAFGHRTIGDSTVRLLIPTFDANRADIHIYKTAHSNRLLTDYRSKAVDVALATSAAPTYFPAHNSRDCVTFVDGGMWANNPTAFAVVEGICVLGWNPHEIDVLSLGCTEESIDFRQNGHSGLFWVRRCFDAAARGQSRSAIGMARHLTGRDKGIENVFRFDPPVAQNRFTLDGVKHLDELRGLGFSEARHALPQLSGRFFATTAEPFVPEGRVAQAGPTDQAKKGNA
jgi:Patatin-like phospholipase